MENYPSEDPPTNPNWKIQFDFFLIFEAFPNTDLKFVTDLDGGGGLAKIYSYLKAVIVLDIQLG